MTPVRFVNGEVLVDAAVIAEGLGLEPESVQEKMREGHITSRCERGTGEDEGRFRLTFFSGSRRYGIVVNDAGSILQRLRLDFGDRALPASARKPGR